MMAVGKKVVLGRARPSYTYFQDVWLEPYFATSLIGSFRSKQRAYHVRV